MLIGLKLLKKYRILIFGLIILSILLFRNPFSGTNNISDLGPIPDAIYYLNPLVNFANNQGLRVLIDGRSLYPSIAPLYSITLLPFYLITSDIRSFYFTNALLTLFSAALFYFILKKIFSSNLILNIIFFSFITNFIFFRYPSMAMAENLLIFLFLLTINLLFRPISWINTSLAGVLTAALYAAKFVAWEISLSFAFVFLLHIFTSKLNRQRKITQVLIYVLTLGIVLSVFTLIMTSYRSYNLFEAVFTGVRNTLLLSPEINHETGLPYTTFSNKYFSDNITRYIAGIMGSEIPLAGQYFTIVPIAVGFVSIPLFLINIFFKKTRLLSLYFALAFFGTVLYVSRLFIVDGRYLLVFVPAMFIAMGIFLENISKLFLRLNRQLYTYLLLFVVSVGIAVSSAGPLVNHIRANFSQDNLPLNYLAAKTIDEFVSISPTNPPPVIITTLSPFFIKFYSERPMVFLPLSRIQPFAEDLKVVWNIDQDKDLTEIYSDYLKQDRRVFVSAHQTDGNYLYSLDFQKIQAKFNLKLVKEGCIGQCSLYELSQK